MRHTHFFRLFTAVFGLWFTFTLVQPNGMMGMTMSGSGAPMSMIMTGPPGSALQAGKSEVGILRGAHDREIAAERMAAMHHGGESMAHTTGDGKSQPSSTPVDCNQHDCCCSALSPISLMPVASLAWLPEHVVNQQIPPGGNCVVHTDGQLRLPFANGPPRTVTA